LAEPLPPRPQNDFPTSRSSTPPSDLHSAHLKSSESRRFHTDSEAGGVPAGLLPTATYEEHSLTLSPGDRLYLCTDGVFEAENPSGQELGVQGLIETLTRNRDLSLEDILSTVMQSVEEWSAPAGPLDDASVLAIERYG
jgi:sigma-B regulation protein RsbU (phosphoserine phosphatase)